MIIAVISVMTAMAIAIAVAIAFGVSCICVASVDTLFVARSPNFSQRISRNRYLSDGRYCKTDIPLASTSLPRSYKIQINFLLDPPY